MHASCVRGMNAIRAGDTWLSRVIPQIVDTPGYQRGRTAIFITWDEGSHGQSAAQKGEDCLALLHLEDQSCHVPTFILSEYVAPGTRSNMLFSHYSLLQTTERLLGLDRFLGHAADPTTTGMRARSASRSSLGPPDGVTASGAGWPAGRPRRPARGDQL